MNNADLGITIQKFICNHFNLEIPTEAKEQFESNYNPDYLKNLALESTIISAFNELGVKPKKCVTYTKSENPDEKLNPHNFILENLKTLSIRTSKSGDKVE